MSDPNPLKEEAQALVIRMILAGAGNPEELRELLDRQGWASLSEKCRCGEDRGLYCSLTVRGILSDLREELAGLEAKS